MTLHLPHLPRLPHPTRRALLGAGLSAGLLQRTLAQTAATANSANTAAPRVALVIGNASYRSAALDNPVKDARAMAAELRQLGFEVIELQDAGRDEMLIAVGRARERLAGRQGTGLFFFAGHGLQLDWRNYMLPVDAGFDSAADVMRHAVDMQRVLDAFATAGSRVNILVLDACRDNPFGAHATGRGLAPVDAPPGTFVAYATAPGHVALDGGLSSGNGLYTRYLLQEMRRPDARIEDVFKRVRLQVRQASQGRQIPWESTSLEHDFVFSTGQIAQAAPPAARDAEFDAEKAEWDRISASTRPEDHYAFLFRHPNGRFSELAQFRFDQLARPAVEPVLQPSMPRALPAGVDRYRVGDSWEIERTDLTNGQVRRLRLRVTSIDSGRVMVNGGAQVLDQMGSVIVNRFGVKDPGMLFAPSGLQVGKRWRTAFTNVRAGQAPARSYYDCRVLALEEVQVPAGIFQVYRVEAKGEAIGDAGGGQHMQWTSWLDSTTMTQVRHDVRFTSLRRGQVTEHTSDLLVWRRLVPRG